MCRHNHLLPTQRVLGFWVTNLWLAETLCHVQGWEVKLLCTGFDTFIIFMSKLFGVKFIHFGSRPSGTRRLHISDHPSFWDQSSYFLKNYFCSYLLTVLLTGGSSMQIKSHTHLNAVVLGWDDTKVRAWGHIFAYGLWILYGSLKEVFDIHEFCWMCIHFLKLL